MKPRRGEKVRKKNFRFLVPSFSTSFSVVCCMFHSFFQFFKQIFPKGRFSYCLKFVCLFLLLLGIQIQIMFLIRFDTFVFLWLQTIIINHLKNVWSLTVEKYLKWNGQNDFELRIKFFFNFNFRNLNPLFEINFGRIFQIIFNSLFKNLWTSFWKQIFDRFLKIFSTVNLLTNIFISKPFLKLKVRFRRSLVTTTTK